MKTPALVYFTVELYEFPDLPAIRLALAHALRRLRNDGGQACLTDHETALYLLWRIGGFKRDTLARGCLAAKQWPLARLGSGRWVTMNPATLEQHDIQVHEVNGIRQRPLS